MIDTKNIELAVSLCTKAISNGDCDGCHYHNDYSGFPRRGDYGETSCVSKLLQDMLSLIKELKSGETDDDAIRCNNCKYHGSPDGYMTYCYYHNKFTGFNSTCDKGKVKDE